MRNDWLIAALTGFVAGVLAMAGISYLLWRSAGRPPARP